MKTEDRALIILKLYPYPSKYGDLTHSDLVLIQQILLNPKSFLKNLDVSGWSIFHVNDPKNYVYLAANPHLTICCLRDLLHETTI